MYTSRKDDSSETKKTAHPDYEKNLENANAFIERVQKFLLPGMRVKVCDSEHLKKALLTISWKPPKEEVGGTYATSIFLHEAMRNVNKKIEGVFNCYMDSATRCAAKNPREPYLFDPGLNNMTQKV